MAKVEDVYKTFFEKKMLALLRQGRKKEQEKIAYYLKLYTNLLGAEMKLATRRGFDHLRIVRHMTKESGHQAESHYIAYINSIARSVLVYQQKIQSVLKEDPTADPLSAKTKLLMAQNICVLRILAISRF